ncbi:MAG: YIP1 family protein [bacterium]|nr:YIP1 family protein [bacterium]MCM1374762.1 YIP1 family protein [Muribaculum sp.]
MKKMIKHFKRIALCLFAVMLLTGSVISVGADAPYKTFTFDGYGYVIQTQTAYLPYETITKFQDEALNGPSDLYVADDGRIYVADTGNARIVVGDLEGNLLQTIGEGTLVSPRGVYVTGNGHVYVADRDAEAVFEFDADGELLNRYGKPNSPLYGDALSFLPIKLVVNDAGIMYVICESNTNGIVEISPIEGGTFLGYFGTNFASSSPMIVIRRALATKAQKAKMVSNIPSTPDNLCIDHKGLIYTVTRGEEEDTLKRLNIAGKNVITPDTYDDIPAAVAAGNHDNVFMVSQQGFVYEFNSEGEALFVFGGSDDGTQRVGLCTVVSAIDVDPQDRLYILDSDKAQIQVYEPTEFTNLLHEALNLYSMGRYTESKAPLEEVLKMNSMFDYANMAMGRAYFQEENYEMAQYYAKLAKDYQGYSDATWEVRNLWLKKWIVPIIWSIVILWVASRVIKKLDQKKGILKPLRDAFARISENRRIRDIRYAWYFMRHPIDGCYGIARENRASVFTANLLVVIFTIEYMINKYMCGFLQKTVREGRYEIFSDIGMVVVVLVALTVCNYLVCTINDGEGTVKKIYCSFTYCLTPYVTLIPLVFLLSHVVTVNEQFLISFGYCAIYVWVTVLFVLAVKEVNNYTAKETFKVLCLTAFTILIMALLIFIIYVLWAQVFEFISAIGGEVVYRIGN